MGTDAFSRRAIGRANADARLDEILLDRLGHGFHPSCTCPIGKVVDPELRIYGVQGLRVADASVFPENISNNLNVTRFIVRERAAALMAHP